jgi:endoglycosylceramidase
MVVDRRTFHSMRPEPRSPPHANRVGGKFQIVLLAALASTAAHPACSSEATTTPPPPPACPGPDFAGVPLGVKCGALVDTQGREVRLFGMNVRAAGVFDVALDDGRTALEPLAPFTPDDARRMRALGVSSLRLPIQWSGVEPTETGGFDEAYLDRVARAVDDAHAAGLLVLVDFHQDAYSKEIGEDGAPYWAIIPPPPAKLAGPLVDLDKRRLSKPVSDAFATFFGTSPDGTRLRARFASMAAHVATRFAHHPGVIGFELFNEPIATSERLRAFHTELLTALRAVAPEKLVFFEPPAIRNLLDSAEIPASGLGPGTVYAPHVYTAAFAGDDVRAAVTKDKLRASYEAARDEAAGWAAPLTVTEYGFPPSAPNFASYLAWHAELAEELGASTWFWLWKELTQGSWGLYDFDASGTAKERDAVVGALSRVRLEACAGRVASIDHRPADGALVVRFFGSETAREHLVSFGARFSARTVRCDDAEIAFAEAEPMHVTCGGSGEHTLAIDYAPRVP